MLAWAVSSQIYCSSCALTTETTRCCRLSSEKSSSGPCYPRHTLVPRVAESFAPFTFVFIGPAFESRGRNRKSRVGLKCRLQCRPSPMASCALMCAAEELCLWKPTLDRRSARCGPLGISERRDVIKGFQFVACRWLLFSGLLLLLFPLCTRYKRRKTNLSRLRCGGVGPLLGRVSRRGFHLTPHAHNVPFAVHTAGSPTIWCPRATNYHPIPPARHAVFG